MKIPWWILYYNEESVNFLYCGRSTCVSYSYWVPNDISTRAHLIPFAIVPARMNLRWNSSNKLDFGILLVVRRFSTPKMPSLTSGVDGEVPAEALADCTLISLPPVLLGHVWPARRVVTGLRVCKQLRSALIVHSTSIVLVQRAGGRCVSEDFRRLPPHLSVTLTLRTWAKRLAGVLGECGSLAHLDLSTAGISAAGAGRLARVLGQSRGLAHLNLCRNRIGAEGVGMLAGVLAECKELTHLDLSQNRIGSKGAGLLVGVLTECKALVHLHLRRNDIGAEGAGWLAE
eukprot:2687255-Rhodomonas_salina.3